jgi:glycosyltransferase involved in cell wall biosynthesis
MKLILLSDINSTHTQKWAGSLAKRGFSIGIFSLSNPQTNWFDKYNNIKLLSDSNVSSEAFHGSSFNKSIYLKLVPALKKAIREFKPDILHAHYATSYGLLGRLSRFHPFIISCWGSDVMDFPKRGILQRFILKNNLKHADKILATSKTIEKYIHEIIKKEVVITPFGVDTNIFKPAKVKSLFSENDLVIGSIKQLEEIYCIDILIKSFNNIKTKYPELSLKLLIVGSGSKENELKSLVNEFKLNNNVIFTGWVENNLISDYHNMIDIFVNISERESFGVSVLEAGACEKAIIASNIDAFSEIIIHNETGILVEPKNTEETFYAIERLITDPDFRKKIGINARKRVADLFDWKKNLNEIIEIYSNIKIN